MLHGGRGRGKIGKLTRILVHRQHRRVTPPLIVYQSLSERKPGALAVLKEIIPISLRQLSSSTSSSCPRRTRRSWRPPVWQEARLPWPQWRRVSRRPPRRSKCAIRPWPATGDSYGPVGLRPGPTGQSRRVIDSSMPCITRCWQRQGQQTAAYDLLTPVYGWFTEGFDTADLQEARALLEALGE